MRVQVAVRAAVRTAMLLAAEVGAVLVLHRVGSAPGFALPRSDPGRWLRESAPLDVTAAVLRVLALGAAWWLLASTVWWLVAAGRGRFTRRAPFAMPGTRRLAEWTLALTLAGGTALTGSVATAATTTAAAATTTTTTPTGVRTGRGLATVPVPEATLPAPEAAVPAPAAAPGPAPADTPPAAPAVAAVHVIAPGENLWTIAAAHLATVTDRVAGAVPAAEVAPYWRALCELNRAMIRSGNPSLVYPGEVLQLPPA